MKQLDKIFEEKLFELNQARSEVSEKLKNFKQMQRLKIMDVQRRLFNEQLSKQISPEQLNQMKTAIEQLREDIQHFKMNKCSITIVNNDKSNYSYKPNIDVQIRNILDKNENISSGDNILQQGSIKNSVFHIVY